MSIQIDGIVIAMLEIFIFFGITITLKDKLLTLRYIDDFSYYWLCFTILTGIWEFCYIVNYYNINKLSQNLITNHEHSWTNEYTIEYVLPNKVANIFYAEYGAWADREYMSDDYWARVIEGTHFGLCALSALTAMVSRIEKINRTYIIFVILSMGTQLMNSILYITQYIIQINDKNSINYPSKEFPAGIMLEHRLFMYINIFWTIMPIAVICRTIEEKLHETINDTESNQYNQYTSEDVYVLEM